MCSTETQESSLLQPKHRVSTKSIQQRMKPQAGSSGARCHNAPRSKIDQGAYLLQKQNKSQTSVAWTSINKTTSSIIA